MEKQELTDYERVILEMVRRLNAKQRRQLFVFLQVFSAESEK